MFKKFIGEGLNGNINSPNTNVLNILRALIEDKNSTIYISSEYQNGSTWTNSGDPRVHFLPSDCGKKIQVVGIQSNEERFNFSLNGIVDVLVEYPREDGTVEMKDKKVFRTYTIIRDGELTMKSISATLSEDSFNKLREVGILYYNGVKVPMNHDYKSNYVYRIDLSAVPIISVNWAQPAQIGLYDLLVEENETKRWISIIKKFISENKISTKDDNVESEFYSESIQSSSTKSKDLKEVECIQYTIKYDFPQSLTDDNIKNTVEILYTVSDDSQEIPNMLKNLQRTLKDIRFKKRCIVYAIESTKNKGNYDWSEAYRVPRSKNKIRQDADIEVNGQKMILQRTVYTKEV